MDKASEGLVRAYEAAIETLEEDPTECVMCIEDNLQRIEDFKGMIRSIILEATHPGSTDVDPAAAFLMEGDHDVF